MFDIQDNFHINGNGIDIRLLLDKIYLHGYWNFGHPKLTIYYLEIYFLLIYN